MTEPAIKPTSQLSSYEQGQPDPLAQLATLYQASLAISQAEDEQQVIDALTKHLSYGLFDRGLVVLLRKRQEPRGQVCGYWDRSPDSAEPDDWMDSNRFPAVVEILHEIPNSQTVEASFRDYCVGLGIHCTATIPIQHAERMLGALVLESRNEFRFTTDFLQPYEALVSIAATALENQRLLSTEQSRVLEQQQQLVEVEFLNKIATTTSSSLALNEILLETLQQLTDVLHGDMAVANLWDQAGEKLELVGDYLMPGSVRDELLRHGFDNSLCSLTATRGAAYQEADLETVSLVPTAGLVKAGYHAYLGTPLIADDQVLGTFGIFGRQRGFFTSRHANLAAAVGRQVGMAVRNALTFQQVQQGAIEIQTAAEISQAAAAELDLETLLQSAVDLIQQRFNYYYVAIFTPDSNGRQVVIRAGTGRVGREMQAMSFGLEIGEHSIIGTAAANRRAHLALDTGTDAVYLGSELLPNTRSEIALPLIARGRMLGVLDVQSDQPAAFSQQTITVLQSMANQIAVAMQNAQLFEELETAATQAERQANELSSVLETYQEAQAATSLRDQIQSIAEGVIAGQLYHRAVLSILDDDWQTIQEISGYAGLTQQEIEVLQNAAPPDREERLLRFQERFQLSNSYFIPAGEDPVADQPTIPSHRPAEDFDTWKPADELLVPLWMGDKLVGILNVDDPFDGQRPTVESLRPLELLASLAARVIENSQLFEDLEQLYQTTSALAQAQSNREINRLIVERIKKLVKAEWTNIFLINQQTGQITDHADAGNRFERRQFVYDDIWDGLGGEVLRSNQPILSLSASDPRESEHYRMVRRELGIGSMIILPLSSGNGVLGEITLTNRADQRQFTKQDLDLLVALANQAAISLTNLQLLDQARQRAIQLQTAAEISRSATSVLDVEILFSETIELIRQRFGYYYVGLFLVDEANTWAVLQAGTGQAGRLQVEAGHRLRVGSGSMIGRSIESGQAQIALDVGEQAVLFANPYLPETRSEMAVPLIVRNRVIGAMTVQSTKEAAFGEQDTAILHTIADQLANAINNARVLEQLQESLVEGERVQRQQVRESWNQQALARGSHGRAGYEYDLMKVKAVKTESDDESAPDPAERHRLSAPLTLRGEVIGALGIEAEEPDHEWTDDEIAIVQSVAEQVALAMDTAYYSEQSERRAGLLAAASRVGQEIASIMAAEDLMHQSVDLIARAFNFYHVSIYALDENGTHAVLQEASGHAGTIMKESNFSLLIDSNSPVCLAIQEQKPRFALDIDQHTWVQNPLLPASRSELAIPLSATGQIFGALSVHSSEAAAFDEVDATVLQTVADQLAVSLENARLFVETRERAAEQQMLFDVTTAAVTTGDQGEMFQKVAQTIHQNLAGADLMIMTVDDEGVLHQRAAIGLVAQQDEPLTIPVGEGIVGWVAMTGEPVILGDVMHSPRYIPRVSSTRSELAVPILVDQNVAGVINIESDEPHAFDLNDMRLLQTLSVTLGAIIKSINLVNELQDANEQLTEVDRVKSEFLANMSHELRTPLNSIIGFSRVILKGIDGPITELQEQDLTSIYSSGQHLLNLINAVLDLSKIEAGKMELSPEPIQMGEVISVVMSTLVGLTKDKHVELIQEVPEDLPPVWADPFRLRQVLLNLGSNASKFTDHGNITIRAAYDPQAVFIQVVDTGIGISEEDMNKLFKSFSQVDSSSTRRVQGSGLGLAISAQLMEMQGGRIWVESEVGIGSTFSIAVPRVNQAGDGPMQIITERDEDKKDTTAAPKTTVKRHILAIDDEQGVIDLYRRYLVDDNYEIEGATDGKQGVSRAIALAGQLSAITVDISMTDQDGWQIVRQLQTNTATRHIPIIICSIKLDQERAREMGIEHYLVKPVLQDDLLQALDACCPPRQQTDNLETSNRR